jgi:hypothetical protein
MDITELFEWYQDAVLLHNEMNSPSENNSNSTFLT